MNWVINIQVTVPPEIQGGPGITFSRMMHWSGREADAIGTSQDGLTRQKQMAELLTDQILQVIFRDIKREQQTPIVFAPAPGA